MLEADLSIAKDILINISSGDDFGLVEVDTILRYVAEVADPDTTVLFSTAFYPEMEGQVRVTIIAADTE